MNVFQRGTAINLVQRFWVIDPISQVAVLTNPTQVTFTVLAPDDVSTQFVFPGAPNIANPAPGIFVCELDPQLPTGIYKYNAVGTGAVEAQSPDEQFQVIESTVETASPPPRPVLGPCTQWIGGQDVANSARLSYDDSAYLFDSVAFNASAALYEISDRRFPGICERKVRPCRSSCGCWLSGPISYGMGPWSWSSWDGGGGWGWYNESGDKFGCSPMSRVRLAGYPVVEISEVLIDGVALPEIDPATGTRNWRLDMWRHLVRMDAPALNGGYAQTRFWPGCQNMSLDDDQPGTFSVTYKWGSDVPQLGRDAAVEIANQLWLALSGAECVLPAGVTRVNRQGIEIERGLLANWMDSKTGTGLVTLDLFLNAYAHGKRATRKPAIFSPDLQPFGRRLGVNE